MMELSCTNACMATSSCMDSAGYIIHMGCTELDVSCVHVTTIATTIRLNLSMPACIRLVLILHAHHYMYIMHLRSCFNLNDYKFSIWSSLSQWWSLCRYTDRIWNANVNVNALNKAMHSWSLHVLCSMCVRVDSKVSELHWIVYKITKNTRGQIGDPLTEIASICSLSAVIDVERATLDAGRLVHWSEHREGNHLER